MRCLLLLLCAATRQHTCTLNILWAHKRVAHTRRGSASVDRRRRGGGTKELGVPAQLLNRKVVVLQCVWDSGRTVAVSFQIVLQISSKVRGKPKHVSILPVSDSQRNRLTRNEPQPRCPRLTATKRWLHREQQEDTVICSEMLTLAVSSCHHHPYLLLLLLLVILLSLDSSSSTTVVTATINTNHSSHATHINYLSIAIDASHILQFTR
jgi:hypothetical protein